MGRIEGYRLLVVEDHELAGMLVEQTLNLRIKGSLLSTNAVQTGAGHWHSVGLLGG